MQKTLQLHSAESPGGESAVEPPCLHQRRSAKAEETQNREYDNDSADKPDQIVHGEPFSC
jgi:hypothetical protein